MFNAALLHMTRHATMRADADGFAPDDFRHYGRFADAMRKSISAFAGCHGERATRRSCGAMREYLLVYAQAASSIVGRRHNSFLSLYSALIARAARLNFALLPSSWDACLSAFHFYVAQKVPASILARQSRHFAPQVLRCHKCYRWIRTAKKIFSRMDDATNNNITNTSTVS